MDLNGNSMKTPKSKPEKITFGKYKGDLIDDVIIKDPNYIRWAKDNIDFFILSESQELLLGNQPEDDDWENDLCHEEHY